VKSVKRAGRTQRQRSTPVRPASDLVLALPNHTVKVSQQEPATGGMGMEYVDGPPLKERLARGPLPLEDALRIAMGAAVVGVHNRCAGSCPPRTALGKIQKKMLPVRH
jgi:hypothetical protein